MAIYVLREENGIKYYSDDEFVFDINYANKYSYDEAEKTMMELKRNGVKTIIAPFTNLY